jgi:hypothetical protein
MDLRSCVQGLIVASLLLLVELWLWGFVVSVMVVHLSALAEHLLLSLVSRQRL